MDPPLAESLLDRVDSILMAAVQQDRPIEMEPFRSQLFEAFVTADGAGLLESDADPDLRAEALCLRMGERWELTSAMKASAEQQQQLPADHLKKMRILWSVLRLWMEWDYAWKRWPEFHQDSLAE